MCGRELVGRRIPNNKIQYTDWGQLSIQIVLSYPGEPGKKVNLASTQTTKEGESLKEFLLKEIVKDVKGEVTPEEFAKLDDADAIWLIEGDHLRNVRRKDHWLRH